MSFKKYTSLGNPFEYDTIYEYNTHYDDYENMMKKSIILMKNAMMIVLTQMNFKLTKIIYGWKNAPMI